MKNKSFEQNSIILFGIMMISNIISYLFQIVLARLSIGVEIFGISNTLISLYSILLVPSACMILVVTHYVAQNTDEEYINKIMNTNVVLIIAFSVLDFSLLIPVCKILEMSNIKEMVILIIGSMISMYGALYIGKLQGNKDFVKFGVQGLIVNVTRLIMCIVVLEWNMGTVGIAITIVISNIASIIYAYKHCNYTRITINFKIDRKILNYFWGLLVSQFFLSIIVNGDVLLIKIFFDNNVVGIYSSASILSKISAYVTGAIIAVIFPISAEKIFKGEKVMPLLNKAILYAGGIAITFSIFLICVGNRVIVAFLGYKFDVPKDYLFSAIVYVIPFAILNIIANFANAIGETKSVTYILSCCVLISLLYAYFWNENIVFLMFGIGCIFCATDLLIYLYIHKKFGEI